MTPLPTYVQIEPVGQCNLRCLMCPIQFRTDGAPPGPPAFMAFETFTRLVDQFAGARDLHLQGLGEPLMHPRFFDMVSYAVNRGLRVTTNTNLTLLNPARADNCVTSGLAELHGSIDGAHADTYERIRPRARFARVVRNLHRLVQARARHGSRTPRIELVMVVMRDNLAELPELVRLAADWGVDGLFVQHLCHDFGEETLPLHYRPMRAFVQDQTLFADEPARVERYFDEAREVAADVGLSLRLPRPTPRAHPAGTPGRKRCDWPWRGAYLSYRGEAMPCCMIATPDRLNFGDMAQEGVGPIWHSARYETFRRELDSDVAPAICQSCSVYRGVF